MADSIPFSPITREIRYIRQKYTNDCSIACIAMLANISYASAMEMTNPKRRWFFQKVNSPEWDDIIRVIRNCYLRVDEWEWGPVHLSEVTSRSIIVIQFNEETTHAVVWDPGTQQIFDPNYEPNTFYNKFYEKLSIGKLSLK